MMLEEMHPNSPESSPPDAEGADHPNDYYDVGWESKDSVVGCKTEDCTAPEGLKCPGTLMYHMLYSRDPATKCKRHEVKAGAPCKKQVSTIESLIPFDCDIYTKVDWIKCVDCWQKDIDFTKECRKEESKDAAAREEADRKYFREEAKRKRQAKAAASAEAVKKMREEVLQVGEGGGGSGGDGEEAMMKRGLAAWEQSLRGGCKLPELKELARANNLMVGGSKGDLAMRLMKVRRHGGWGVCPKCGDSKISFEYGEGADPILGMPKAVRCHHVFGMGRTCKWRLEGPDMEALGKPLKDTEGALLASRGIPSGSVIADLSAAAAEP